MSSIPVPFRLINLSDAQYLVFLSLFACIITLGITYAFSNDQTLYAIQYSNYTSQKYQIQFQYPSDWEFKEKLNRFEEGTDLTIQKIDVGSSAAIMVSRYDDLVEGFGSTDFTTAFYKTFRDAIGTDYSQEYRVIEQPSFINIDGHKTGTYLYTLKDKYEDSPTMFATQNWMTFIGNHHGYMIGFWSPTSYFDSPEVTEIRNHFINSIKFLDANNSTNINLTSNVTIGSVN